MITINMKKALISAILLFIAVIASACGDTRATQDSEEMPEIQEDMVVLRVGGLSDVDGWNPWINTSPYSLGSLVLEGFADHGPSEEGFPAVPRLADSWEVSDDGLTWTIHLHEGITFSDGTAVDANTAKEYLDWLSTEEMLFGLINTASNIASVEVIDDLTLQYTNFEPMISSAENDFPFMYILPPYIWSELGEDLFTYENAEMIGTGPYVIEEYVPGSHVIFNAREDYYRGKPEIDQIIYQIYTNNDALVNALISGEIDLTMPDLPPEAFDTLSENPDITVVEKYPLATYDLAFNLTGTGTGNPVLQDPALRMAIDQAIDKHQIVDVIFLGHATAGPTNWAVGPYYEDKLNPDLTITPFDPDAARQTLEEAGYLDTDGDGVRETPEGEPLELRLLYATDYVPSQTIAESITDWLSEIGIRVNAEAVDYGTWFSSVIEERDFDMALNLRLSDYDPASLTSTLYNFAADETGSYSTSSVIQEIEDLIYAYMFSVDEDRWEIIFEAQRLLNEERLFITLAGTHQIQAYRNDRFVFPEDVTHVDIGLLALEGVLNVEVVE